MGRIVIVEDETRISSFLDRALASAGHSTTVVVDGREALDVALSGSADLILLDVGLPGMDGFEVLERLRGSGSTVPVIMLTARDTTRDTVRGLDGGADDYLAKPFKLDELLARIRSRLRDAPAGETAALQYGDLSLDIRTRRATVDGVAVDLSAREFALAEEFLTHPQQVLSREQLLSRVWGLDFDPGSNVVEVYVRYLRGKFGKERIETVRGMGYRLR